MRIDFQPGDYRPRYNPDRLALAVLLLVLLLIGASDLLARGAV